MNFQSQLFQCYFKIQTGCNRHGNLGMILCDLPQLLRAKAAQGTRIILKQNVNILVVDYWLFVGISSLLKHIMDFSSFLYGLNANKIYGNNLSWALKSLLICRIGTLENASGIFPFQHCKATVTDFFFWCRCDARTLKRWNECTPLNMPHTHPPGDCQKQALKKIPLSKHLEVPQIFPQWAMETWNFFLKKFLAFTLVFSECICGERALRRYLK